MTRPKLTIDEDGERAVSPVIGVILMVAITVILAAVIGTFVLDLGQNVQNTGPSASMGMSDAEATFNDSAAAGLQDFIVIEHQSGESLDGDAIRIVVRNVSDNSIVATYDAGSNSTSLGDGSNWKLNNGALGSSNTTQVGDQIILEVNPGSAGPKAGFEYTITVVSTDTDNRIATGTVEVN